MLVKRLAGSSPDGTLQEVVVVEVLGGQQFLECSLSTVQTLDEPEVPEARQPWGLDDQEIGGMARDGSKGMSHIGRNHHQISLPSHDYPLAS